MGGISLKFASKVVIVLCVVSGVAYLSIRYHQESKETISPKGPSISQKAEHATPAPAEDYSSCRQPRGRAPRPIARVSQSSARRSDRVSSGSIPATDSQPQPSVCAGARRPTDLLAGDYPNRPATELVRTAGAVRQNAPSGRPLRPPASGGDRRTNPRRGELFRPFLRGHRRA